jgi:hypothetical protein
MRKAITIAWLGIPIGCLWLACGGRSAWVAADTGAGPGAAAGTGGLADGGTGTAIPSDASLASGNQPLTQTQATALFHGFVVQDIPNYNPASVFSVEELVVPGVWAATGVQLFVGGAIDDYGYIVNQRPFATRAGKVYPLTKYSGTGLLSAALVGQKLYYSIRAGSGINYSELGRISLVGDDLAILHGPDFANDLNLYLRVSGERIVVELGSGLKLNSLDWTPQGVFGWLKDEGDRLVVVDEAGQEIPSVGPGGAW